MFQLSERVQTMTSSPTLKLVQIKNQLQAQGKVILDFGAGEPDFSTPENIKKAGVAAIKNNFTKYTQTSGISELKNAIRLVYQQEQGKTNRGFTRQQIQPFLVAASCDQSRGRSDHPPSLLGLLSGNGEILRRPGDLCRPSAAGQAF
jgi:hypothetical protein